jgi:subtilisin family serine protease
VRVNRCTATGQRVWRFEILEERIALSVTDPPDFVLDYVDRTADFAGRIGPVDAAWIVPQATVGQADPAATIRSEYGLTGAGQTVAVIDSGIAWDHIALGGGYGAGYRVVGGWDFTGENDANPYDDGPLGSHGTHVAGIIGADSDQLKGIAPGVDLVALRVFDDNGAGYFEWVEDALQWVHDNRNALANPITTVNLSLGANDNSSQPPDWAMLEDELAQLADDDIFVAVAAGNAFATFQTPGLSYPASSAHVVPVMAVDADGGLSDFSQRLPRAIAAPGRWVTSSVPDYVGDQNGRQDDFARYSGTSMASPSVAGTSVLIREAMELAGESNVSPDAIYAVMQQTAHAVYDAATSQFYSRVDVAAAIAAVMPEDLNAVGLSEPKTPLYFTDLGQVTDTQLTDLRYTEPNTWYRVEVTRDGLLTVEARLASVPGNVNLELYDADFTRVASSTTSSDQERIDFAALASDVYYIRVIGTNDSVDLHIANLVSPSDTTVHVFGTAGDDTFQFTPGQQPQLTVNGLRYELDGSQFVFFTFDGGTGKDSAVLDGSTGNDIAVLRPGVVEVYAAGYRVTVRHVATASVNGRRGRDIAYFRDSAGDDTFVGNPALAKLYGTSYDNEVTQFARVYAYASDGFDKAYLYDSAGDDIFRSEATSAKLFGVGFQNYAANFDRVYGYASEGYDKAYLNDSSRNGIFHAETTFAKLDGVGFHNYAEHFDRIYSNASRRDAKGCLRDSASDDIVHAETAFAKIYGRGFDNDIAKFDRFHAYTTNGYARADLLDAPGNNLFPGDGFGGSLYSIGFRNDAQEFERVSALAQEGNSRALFEGLGTGDLVYGRDSVTRLSRPTRSNEVTYGFDRLTAAARDGGSSRVDAQQFDDVFQQLGSWT